MLCLQAPQWVAAGQWLWCRDVQPCTANTTLPQGINEIVCMDDLASRHVDDDSMLLHLLKLRLCKAKFCVGRESTGSDDDVCLTEVLV